MIGMFAFFKGIDKKFLLICITAIVIVVASVIGYFKFVSYMNERDERIATSAVDSYKQQLQDEINRKRQEDESKKSDIKDGLKGKTQANKDQAEQKKKKIETIQTEQEVNDSFKEAMRCLVDSC